jgi:site-specific recombinase XerC
MREAQHAFDHGTASAASRKIKVETMLEHLLKSYVRRGLASLRTIRQHVSALLDVRGTNAAGEPIFGMDGLHNVKVEDVTSARLDEMADRWDAAGASGALINRRLSTLRNALHLGMKMTPPLVFRCPRWTVRTENVRTGFTDDVTLGTILLNLPDDGLREAVEWAYLTGMRKGTLQKLEWSHYNAETKMLTVPGALLKQRKPWLIPCVGDLLAVIERCRAVRTQGRIFTRRRPDGSRAPVAEFRKPWKKACAAAGVPDLMFHDLRRSGVRNVFRATKSQQIAMQISGHKTVSVFQRYNIVDEDDLKQAVEKVTKQRREALARRPAVPEATTETVH